MCIGVPMQVIVCEERRLLAEGRSGREWLDCALLGPQPPGAWVLGFLGHAREVLDPERARAMGAALDALEAALAGTTADIDACFPDLAGRTPQLPEHLRHLVKENAT